MSDLAAPDMTQVRVPLREQFSTRRLILIGVFKQTYDYTKPRQLATAKDTERWEALRTRSISIGKEITDDTDAA